MKKENSNEEMYISFYLKYHRIHVFVDVLRNLGSPERICFMLSEDKDKIAIAPYDKRDLRAVEVPDEIYNGTRELTVSNYEICKAFARVKRAKKERSYRAPGEMDTEHNIAIFDLKKAEIIE